MTRQRLRQQRESLARLLTYVLGHRPDEFGLVLDEEGFVPLKELLSALKEEEGWAFLRQSHVEELRLEPGGAGFELREKRIRLRPPDQASGPGLYPVVQPPAVLYGPARPKAYPVIQAQGLKPAGRPWVPLYLTPELALRVGRRRDREPVLLKVHAARAHDHGVVFRQAGELIFLVEGLAPEYFSGPPLPQDKPPKEKKKPAPPPEPPPPGSFFLDEESLRRAGPKQRSKKKKDGPEWKRAARKMRRRRGS